VVSQVADGIKIGMDRGQRVSRLSIDIKRIAADEDLTGTKRAGKLKAGDPIDNSLKFLVHDFSCGTIKKDR
jgi:hypothetical protein